MIFHRGNFYLSVIATYLVWEISTSTLTMEHAQFIMMKYICVLVAEMSQKSAEKLRIPDRSSESRSITKK